MKGRKGFLVVGGDSLVGGFAVRALRKRGHCVLASTRRRETVDECRVFLDFEAPNRFLLPEGIDYVFVIAAATNYDRCENDPLARVVNEEHIPRLIGDLLEQGAFVTFISTNSVFGGERPWPDEDAPHEPGIAYAKQKSLGERTIRERARALGALEHLNITRLTKILHRDTPPLPNWVAAWERGETVSPFADLIFAPLSSHFVGEALATIGEKRVPGNLHLSGASNVSYVDLAMTVAGRLGVDPALIVPTTATEKGVNIAFKPTYSGLGMKRTFALCGIEPQPLSGVVEDIFSNADQQDIP